VVRRGALSLGGSTPLAADDVEPSAGPDLPWPAAAAWPDDPRLRSAVHLTVVPAERISETVGVVGWLGAANVLATAELVAVLRRWEDLWGLVPTAIEVEGAVLHLLARRPPLDADGVRRMLMELCAVSDEVEAHVRAGEDRTGARLGAGDYRKLARGDHCERFIGHRWWSMWWD
jgi:hypothetical protein